VSLRERKRAQTYASLAAHALALFDERGFEATPVDAIAEAAGVSRRTFFRYYDTKEAVFFANQQRRLQVFTALIEHPEPGESPYETLRRAFRVAARAYMAEREQLLREHAIIAASRTLAAAELQVDAQWEASIAGHLGGRRGAILAGAIVGMTRAVLREWYASEGHMDLETAAEEGFRILEAGIGMERRS
jgi:AcrR family transcriptional regulator